MSNVNLVSWKKIWLVALLPTVLWGQTRKYSNEFLNIGVDARAMAMSKAVTATVGDVTSGYWNPAGLAQINDSWQASALHAEYFASIAQYDYAAFAMPLDATSTAGVSLVRLGVDDILDTTQLFDEDGNVDYDRINRFSAADYALLISYARQASGIANLSYGANLKLIYRNIGKFANAVGFGFDLGAQYQIKKWQLGLMIRDVTTTFNAWNINEENLRDVFERTDNELPSENLELTIPRINLGLGRSFNLGEKYRLTTGLDASMTFGGRQNTLLSSSLVNISPAVGAEVAYKDFIFLRGGAGNVTAITNFDNSQDYIVQPSLGLGFKYRGIYLDYGLTNIGNGDDAVYSNIFSVKFKFAEFNRS